MSQEQSTEAQRAEVRTQDTLVFVCRVRTLTRRKYTPEEKIRIVLDGFRRETTVNDPCRREGIKPGGYYAWTKEFGMQSRPMNRPSNSGWYFKPAYGRRADETGGLHQVLPLRLGVTSLRKAPWH